MSRRAYGFQSFKLDVVTVTITEETISNRPLQKRERTGKEYGCFPFV